MNPYHYVLSLRLRHPTVDLSVATSRLGLVPTRMWRVGVPRTDINGAALSGVYAESYWTAPLLNAVKLLSTKVSLDESLVEVVCQLGPHRDFLVSLRNSGGTCACSVGVFASANFGIEIPAALMQRLVELGIDLGLDAYP
jgi:hypothetical protein